MKPEEIKALRIKLMLTQKEFGALFGVSNRAVCYWENGTKEPSLAHLRELVKLRGK